MTELSNAPVTRRFFEALDYLKRSRIIHSRAGVAERYGIDRRNLTKLRKDPSRNMLKPFWLTGLVADYKVSAHWLLTGEGDIISND